MVSEATSQNDQHQPSMQTSSPQNQSNSEEYSVYKIWQKRTIILAAAVAGFFSPLSSTIYLPALTTLAEAEHVSNSLINLTITSYLIFQGLAPTFIGGFSDSAGRRPAYMICFVLYIGANLGLALQRNYAALLILRMLQSSGSSATIALSNAVAADLVTSAERGSYIGYVSVPSLLGPTLAPIIGGLLSQYAGWQWIFWFLLILAVAFFVPFLLFFPETCRKVVGNGSILPPRLSHSLPSLLRERKLSEQRQLGEAAQKRDEMAKNRKLQFPNPLGTLRIVFDKQAGIILISVSILFSCFYVISASLPSQFSTRYHLNDAQLGLLYLPVGVGGIISAVTTGKMIDSNYRRWARKLGRPVVRNKQDDLTDFPIEMARLQIAMPMLYLGAAGVIAYGWLVEANAGIAGPCVCMFVFGYAMIGGFNVMNILLVDIYPGKPASATAANNLVRCWMGAGASALVIPLVDAIGMGWACTLAGLIWVGFSPLLLILMRYGPKWRKEQKAKKDARKDAKAAASRDPTVTESTTGKDLASKEFEAIGRLMSPPEADMDGFSSTKDLEAQR